MRLFALLVLLAGCDMLFQLDHVGPARGDAQGGDGVVADGAIDAPQSSACNLASLTQILIDQNLADPAQRQDQLELYMSRLNGGDYDLFVSKRASKTEPWGMPVYDSVLSSDGTDDNDPSLFMGDTMMLFISERSGTRQLYQTSRTTITDAWSAPITISTSGKVLEAFDVSPDGLTLYGTESSGALSVFHRNTVATGFGAPGTIGSPMHWPSLTGDQLVIYYERNSIIYRETRGGLTAGFSKEEMLIAGGDPDITDDGKSLVFANDAGLAHLDCQ